jgi:glycosyltransferase involved in cell wall biosynthesis
MTEGTYPYAGGGVSTWCDVLCRGLSEIDFFVIAVTGTPIATLKYQLPPNVRSVRQVPLWGSEEPSEYVRPDTPFADIYLSRNETTEDVVREHFIPLFERFLEQMLRRDVTEAADPHVVHEMYRYFKQYEYKSTLQAHPTWQTFCSAIIRRWSDEQSSEDEQPSLYDLTTTMRWLYNFLMPLNAEIPRTDIAHSTLAGISNLPIVVAKMEYGTPVIVTDHGIYIRERYIAISSERLTPFAKRFLLRLSSYASRLLYTIADQVSPVCNYNMRWESRFGAEPGRIKTIYNGVDPGVFIPKEKPEKTRNRPTVVAAARVFPLKDIETMIRSCAFVREKIPDVHYIVYGPMDIDPPYTERCLNLIREFQLEANFEFAGFHSKPHELYHEGDISILSSISEGFPYTVIESMACGRPVVATDVGGVREALEGLGIIAKPKDARGLADGVVELLLNDELRQRLGSSARERVLLRFRTSISVEAYLRSYMVLANTRSKAVSLAQSPLPPMHMEEYQ